MNNPLIITLSILLFSEQCNENAANKEPFPKIFHQMWPTNDVPERWNVLQEKCQTLNPDYKYMLWTDSAIEKFLLNEYSWFLHTYNSYPYTIQRTDAARLFILYHYGGVYLDMDTECLLPFDDIIKKETKNNLQIGVLLAYTVPVGIVNHVLVAKERHPFLKYMIDYDHLVESKGWYILPHYTVMASAGPIYLLRAW